jgi:CheY-like chemotaxis protein
LIAFLAEPATADIPVIILLDADDAGVVRRARSAGAADCLVTPTDSAEIVARIWRHSRTRLLALQRDEALRALEDTRKELAAAQSDLARLGQSIDRTRGDIAEGGDRQDDCDRPDMGSPAAAVLAGRLPLAILVADDNVINQRVAAGLLKRLGYAADVVADGLAVLDRLEQRSYDVILLDRQMPRLDGHDAARRIRARPLAAGTRRPLLVAMSANDTARDREDGLAAGMDAFLPKPLNLETLKALLERHGAQLAQPS